MRRVEAGLNATVPVMVPPDFPMKQIHRNSGFRLAVRDTGKNCALTDGLKVLFYLIL